MAGDDAALAGVVDAVDLDAGEAVDEVGLDAGTGGGDDRRAAGGGELEREGADAAGRAGAMLGLDCAGARQPE